jgi:hypothetical protein
VWPIILQYGLSVSSFRDELLAPAVNRHELVAFTLILHGHLYLTDDATEATDQNIDPFLWWDWLIILSRFAVR